MAPIAAVHGGSDPATDLDPILAAFDDCEGRNWERRHLDGVALASGSRATPGSDDARLYSTRDLRVLFEGRIDDRAGLRRALSLADDEDREDAALVARAYERWGPRCLRHLVGAYALVVWDGAQDRLLCARDPTGIRHLFYAADEGRVAVATDPGPVVRHPRVTDAIDRRTLAGYLTRHMRSGTATFHRAANRLRPGERLLVDGTTVSRARYWSYGVPDLEDASTGALAAALRDRLRTAVACRLEGAAAPAVSMSGGLDSTGVAALARDVSPDTDPVRAVSILLDDVASVDESTGVRAMRSAADVPVETVTPTGIGPFDDPPLRDRISPSHPCLDASLPLYAAAFRAAGAESEVLLTGLGGNLLDGDRSYYLDLLADRAVPQVATELVAGGLSIAELLVYLTWLARGRDVAVREFETLRGRPDDGLVSDRLARRTRSATSGPPLDCFDRFERTFLYRALADPYMDFAAHAARRLGRARGIDQRHPFLDVRVVDLLFSLPAGCRYSGGEHKRLYRTAMADLLPQPVLSQSATATGYDGYLAASYARNADSLATVAPRALRAVGAVSDAAAASLSAGPDASAATAKRAWRVLSAERWLRDAEAREA